MGNKHYEKGGEPEEFNLSDEEIKRKEKEIEIKFRRAVRGEFPSSDVLGKRKEK